MMSGGMFNAADNRKRKREAVETLFHKKSRNLFEIISDQMKRTLTRSLLYLDLVPAQLQFR